MPVIPPLFLSLPPELPLHQPAQIEDLTGEADVTLLGPGVNATRHNGSNIRFVVGSPLAWQKNTDIHLAQVQISIPTPSSPPPAREPENSPPEPLETFANRQEYDTLRQLFNAIGDVLIRFRAAELTADRVQTDLHENILVAEGNVVLTRGDQVDQHRRKQLQVPGAALLLRIGA